VIKTTESNLNPYVPHAGKDVVWLVDVPILDADHGLRPDLTGKGEVRIEVNVRATRSLNWPPGMKMEPLFRNAFVEAGGGWGAAQHWYIHTAPIHSTQWVSIDVFNQGDWNRLRWSD
jgi:hypothetical protein